jgi:hypothetical protein
MALSVNGYVNVAKVPMALFYTARLFRNKLNLMASKKNYVYIFNAFEQLEIMYTVRQTA